VDTSRAPITPGMSAAAVKLDDIGLYRLRLRGVVVMHVINANKVWSVVLNTVL
jgi:hypothetical protein